MKRFGRYDLLVPSSCVGVRAVDDDQRAGVRIEHIDGQWAVELVENGEITQHLFETEEFARNFAAGQWLRLNPKPIPPMRRRRR